MHWKEPPDRVSVITSRHSPRYLPAMYVKEVMVIVRVSWQVYLGYLLLV